MAPSGYSVTLIKKVGIKPTLVQKLFRCRQAYYSTERGMVQEKAEEIYGVKDIACEPSKMTAVSWARGFVCF
jgi:hypothetical protein